MKQKNQTLYEMAVSIWEQYYIANDLKPDEETIQTDAIPALVNWLFKGYKQIIDTNKQLVWDEYITEFMFRYINREACSSNNKVFRGKIIYPMIEYKTYIENADGLYDEINSALGNLKITSNKKESEDITKNRTVDNSLESTQNSTQELSRSGQNTRDGKENNSNTSAKTDTLGTTRTISYNSGETTEGSTSENKTVNNTQSATNSGNARTVNSDYPQSVVNAGTTGNPDVQTWTYASLASDSNTNGTNSTTTEDKTNSTNTNSIESSRTGSDSYADTGTIKTDASDTNTRTIDDDIKYNETNNNNINTTNSQTTNATDNYTKDTDVIKESITEQQVLTDIALLTKKIEFWKKHKLRCVDDVINICEKYFISEYVDEKRDGCIDWIGNLNLLKYINAEGV